MKVLLSWLREFAPVEGDPVEIGDQLSGLGLAVDEMTIIGGGLDGVVVARVLDLRPHPDADRIQLVDVDAGDGEALQICCGAFNMSVGDLVPLATLGTTMANGMEIARRKMRGEWSNGMLCAAEEIGLGDDQDGIMVLEGSSADDGPTPGTPLAEALELVPDVLYDLEVNPNRPDAMSIAGVARDLAARQGVAFTLLVRTRTGDRSGRFPRTSTIPGANVAPASASSSTNRRIARSATSGSLPRSKRAEASLRRPSRRDDVVMVIGSHQAISRRIDVVLSETSVEAPPIIPAMPIAVSVPSAITPSEAVSVRTSPSRVSSASPSIARRTRSATAPPPSPRAARS